MTGEQYKPINRKEIYQLLSRNKREELIQLTREFGRDLLYRANRSEAGIEKWVKDRLLELGDGL